jgi:hypothetical protein
MKAVEYKNNGMKPLTTPIEKDVEEVPAEGDSAGTTIFVVLETISPGRAEL